MKTVQIYLKSVQCFSLDNFFHIIHVASCNILYKDRRQQQILIKII
jgi:hypothetical protein